MYHHKLFIWHDSLIDESDIANLRQYITNITEGFLYKQDNHELVNKMFFHKFNLNYTGTCCNQEATTRWLISQILSVY